MKNLRLSLAAACFTLVLISCGGGGGGGTSASPSTATNTASNYTAVAMAGELLTFSLDTTNRTYSYTITDSQYGLTGQTGSGTLVRNSDGTYSPSGITNAKIVILPNGLLLGAISATINNTLTTIPIIGISNPVTSFTSAAGTYNYVQRYCISGTCYSDYGTFQITASGTWNSCSLGNLTSGCTGTSSSGTLSSLGGGKWQVMKGATNIGTALVLNSNGQNVVVLDLNNPSNGLGLLFGSGQQTINTAQTDGTWAAASTTGLNAIFTASGNLINYLYINGVTSTATATMTLDSPWTGIVTSSSGGYGILAGSGVYGYVNTNGYAEIGVKINPITTPVLSFGPGDNAAVFWIDQANPNQNIPPTYQKWGQVFTAPFAFGQEQLSSIKFYVSAGGPPGNGVATYFMINLYSWSDTLMQPTGVPLYTSSQVLFSAANTNPPDPTCWNSIPTVFPVNTQVIPGNRYIAEIIGDGAVGIAMATGYAGDGLYMNQSPSTTWTQFSNNALCSYATFSSYP